MMVDLGRAGPQNLDASGAMYCKSSDCTGYLFMEPFLNFFKFFSHLHVHDSVEQPVPGHQSSLNLPRRRRSILLALLRRALIDCLGV